MAHIQYRSKPYSPGHWQEVSEDLLSVEHKAFLRARFNEYTFKKEFDNPKNTISLIEYISIGKVWITKKIIGYALVKPTRKKKQARLLSIAIAPAHQGKGLFKRLMHSVEGRLKKKKFNRMKLEARVKNQFNVKVKQVYKRRIEKVGKPVDTNMGLFEPMVIKL